MHYYEVVYTLMNTKNSEVSYISWGGELDGLTFGAFRSLLVHKHQSG